MDAWFGGDEEGGFGVYFGADDGEAVSPCGGTLGGRSIGGASSVFVLPPCWAFTASLAAVWLLFGNELPSNVVGCQVCGGWSKEGQDVMCEEGGSASRPSRPFLLDCKVVVTDVGSNRDANGGL